MEEPAMQGYLLKWTNYMKGFQKRYFVLKGGVLSYYWCVGCGSGFIAILLIDDICASRMR